MQINDVVQKILWIGPMKFRSSGQDIIGGSKLAIMLDNLNIRNCEITFVGNMACKVFTRVSSSASIQNVVDNASVLWEILKGRKLPGLVALDRVCILNSLSKMLLQLHTKTRGLFFLLLSLALLTWSMFCKLFLYRFFGNPNWHISVTSVGVWLPFGNWMVQAYPFEINWNAIYADPTQFLVVDIGSGISHNFLAYYLFIWK